MNEDNLVSYTPDQLRRMPSKTDWARVNALTDKEIEQNAQNDPDAPPMTADQWSNAVMVVPGEEGKERIAIWIDKDVLRHFGKGSKGYQKRLNTALRQMMVAELLYGKNVSA
jgi:uncharacterized protein (DUF4415 family)